MAEVALHPEARREYRAAVGWYQGRSPAAARRFVAEVERMVAQVRANPERYAWHDDEFREAMVSRFPYVLIYRVEPTGDVLVVAVAHASRQPGYWHGRA